MSYVAKDNVFPRDAPLPSAAIPSCLSQETFEGFFSCGGLTVYSSTPSPWRWLIAGGQRSLQATLIDPYNLFEREDGGPSLLSARAIFAPELSRPEKEKTFEQSRLVKWLTRAANHAATGQQPHFSTLAEPEDIEAFLKLVHFTPDEWNALNALPSLTAAEVRHFSEGHNAALSDIESAFLPARVELPLPLAGFYIRYLVHARRDVEATLLIAQASSSTRLPRLMADALAVGAFEGAGNKVIHFEGHDYAESAAQDTSACVDSALAIIAQKLALPVDHAEHLLRVNIMDISRMAAQIVETSALSPFAFLSKAKALYAARADVCRYAPLQRFAVAAAGNDLSPGEAWVQRIALAYDRLFEGKPVPLPQAARGKAEILRFGR